MKRRTETVLVGAVLVAFVAFSSLRRGAGSQKDDGRCGACCPLVQAMEEMSRTAGTNRALSVVGTNAQTAANRP